ncbi:MAG: hypothetical protein B6A08_00695 [Sorangiineae bacterium NIC37A_2]|jgi:hypothetical protein|nr:MAG: hypothetical protein B6A08_00695 [Sorangiineae bacterium NIC37A_2]
MPTFLTTEKMHPELRARIQRSVSGQTTSGRTERPGLRALFRATLLLGIGSLAAFLLLSYQAEVRELESARRGLKAQLSSLKQALTPDDLELGERIQTLIAREADSYQGDVQGAPETWTPSETRAALYVRLSLADAQSAGRVEQQSLESRRDALLDCFLDPPETRDESSLLRRVRQVYSGARPELSSVHPVSSVFLSLVYLAPAFEAQVDAATSRRILNQLESSVREARLPRLTPALRASTLILALDEPKDPGVASEVDGASRHFIRLVVADLRDHRVLLRARREVDPNWISEKVRFRYALGLDGCRFARDVRLNEKNETGAEP